MACVIFDFGYIAIELAKYAAFCIFYYYLPEFEAEILAKYVLRSLYMRLKTIFWLPYEIWNKF